MIVTEHRAGAIGEPTTAEVIDGQQRLTTTQLLALAFRDAVAGMDDTFLRQCMDTYTTNAGSYRAPRARYKGLAWLNSVLKDLCGPLIEALAGGLSGD